MTADDDGLMDDLRRVLDAMDAALVPNSEAAKEALAWRRIDAELAQLVFDSEIDSSESDVVLRGRESTTRQLTFSTGDVTIDIEISSAGLMGQIIPAEPASVELHQGDREPVAIETDQFGVFAVTHLNAGPTTFIARARDGSWSVRTAWTVT